MSTTSNRIGNELVDAGVDFSRETASSNGFIGELFTFASRGDAKRAEQVLGFDVHRTREGRRIKYWVNIY